MSHSPKSPAVSIMASARNGTIYVGVTSNLPARAAEHRQGTTPGFTSKYRCVILVYFEMHADMPAAIAREKQLKAGSRFKKLALIETTNPTWRDLYQLVICSNISYPIFFSWKNWLQAIGTGFLLILQLLLYTRSGSTFSSNIKSIAI